jgi:hypothetical protein
MRTLRRVMLMAGVAAACAGGGSPRGWVRGRRWRLRSLSGSALALKPGVLAMRFSGRGSVASRALASVGSLMCVATVCSLAASSSALAASPVVVTFSPSSQYQTFRVPGVRSLQILVRGGGGGSGFSGGSTDGAGGGGTQVTGTLAVSPEDVLYVLVGGAGSNATAPNTDGACAVGNSSAFSQGGAGGANASASGGDPMTLGGVGGAGDYCLGGGGGGGGADTTLLQNNGSTYSVDAGGGGGGGGGGGIAGYGGGAGGDSGFFGGFDFPGQDGSGPGHGSGGAPAAHVGGLGGTGTDAAPGSSAGGGGGGGGGYQNGGDGGTGGGGGAGGGGGGGAGDSYVASSVSHVSFSTGPSGADGTVVISYTPSPLAIHPPVVPKLHLAVAGPRGVRPGHTAAYRITLGRTQSHSRRGYAVRNVHVVSTHAGHRVGHWLVRTLPRGRSRTMRLKLNVPSTARGSFCITTRAAARHTRSAAVRYCTAVVTAPPHGLG